MVTLAIRCYVLNLYGFPNLQVRVYHWKTAGKFNMHAILAWEEHLSLLFFHHHKKLMEKPSGHPGIQGCSLVS